MVKSGAAEFVSNFTVSLLQPYGLMAIMAGFFVLTTLLTQPMSNAAAALVVLPVALQTAQKLGVNERTFHHRDHDGSRNFFHYAIRTGEHLGVWTR